VVKQLGHKAIEKDNYLIKYGAEGDDFYIVLKGEVSVWIPMTN